MVRIFALVTMLVCSFLLGSVTFALDRDRTRDHRDQDKTVLHDQDRLKTQDKLYTQDKEMSRELIRARDQDKLHAPGNSGMIKGPGTSNGTGRGRR